MKFVEYNNDIIFKIENGDSKVIRDLVLAKCRLIMLELNAFENLKVNK